MLKKVLSLPFQYRFLVFCVFVGVFINLIYLSYEAFTYSKQYVELNRNIAECEKYNVLKLVCDPKKNTLRWFEYLDSDEGVDGPRHEYKSKGKFVPDDIEVRKKHALASTMQDMAESIYNEMKRTQNRMQIYALVIFFSSLSFGFLPIFWSFFLKRISDLSKAIRGIY